MVGSTNAPAIMGSGCRSHIGLVTLFSPTPVQEEVHNSLNWVVVEDVSCSSSFIVGRSLAISLELEVPQEERSLIFWCYILNKDLGEPGSTWGVSSTPNGCDPSLLVHHRLQTVNGFQASISEDNYIYLSSKAEAILHKELEDLVHHNRQASPILEFGSFGGRSLFAWASSKGKGNAQRMCQCSHNSTRPITGWALRVIYFSSRDRVHCRTFWVSCHTGRESVFACTCGVEEGRSYGSCTNKIYQG